MEDLLRPIYQERASLDDTLAILIIERNKPLSPLTDNFDTVLIIITKTGRPWYVKHYAINKQKIALHVINEDQLKTWLNSGGNKRLVQWLLNGKIIFDRNEYLHKLKETLNEFPVKERKKKIGIEFAKLIRRFMEGKALYQSNHYLDAYNEMMHALHHLARLAVIEQGFHPEVTLWDQVKKIDREVYKLYEQLLFGEESIEKRIELLLLASEFLISKKTVIGAQHVLSILNNNQQVWSISDLMAHKDMEDYTVDLSALIEHLVDKKLIAVVNEKTKGKGVFHRLYRLV